MRFALTFLVAALTGATGIFWYEHGICWRLAPSAAPSISKGAKQTNGRLRVFPLDGGKYALDFNGLMIVRQSDGLDAKKGVRIHLEVDDPERQARDLAQGADVEFGDVTGFVSDDPEDSQ